jgi:hypothetical protein
VKVWVRLTGEIERHLLVEREEFIRVPEKVPKPALRRPEPVHLHTRVYPALTLVPFVGLSHVAYKLLNHTNKFGGTKRMHPQIDAQLGRLRVRGRDLPFARVEGRSIRTSSPDRIRLRLIVAGVATRPLSRKRSTVNRECSAKPWGLRLIVGCRGQRLAAGAADQQ